ncbi:MAG TPA: hypothetical protein VJM34_02565 [Novosphingobium sp.]|uniref:hypothetical protein n=1 Tax=Sphingobium sp. TB-6 TaxID=2728850 RepID=UPI001F0FCC09|nr:hypothetical protein [Sphingobium sp. TB-6]HKX77382.1 hypothetical protein [Novosphingobium sp.]
MEKAQLRPLRDQQIDREVDRILIGRGQIAESFPELIGVLNVPARLQLYSM